MCLCQTHVVWKIRARCHQDLTKFLQIHGNTLVDLAWCPSHRFGALESGEFRFWFVYIWGTGRCWREDLYRVFGPLSLGVGVNSNIFFSCKIKADADTQGISTLNSAERLEYHLLCITKASSNNSTMMYCIIPHVSCYTNVDTLKAYLLYPYSMLVTCTFCASSLICSIIFCPFEP